VARTNIIVFAGGRGLSLLHVCQTAIGNWRLGLFTQGFVAVRCFVKFVQTVSCQSFLPICLSEFRRFFNGISFILAIGNNGIWLKLNLAGLIQIKYSNGEVKTDVVDLFLFYDFDNFVSDSRKDAGNDLW